MERESDLQAPVIELGAVTAVTRGIPVWMHEESTGEMDYRD